MEVLFGLLDWADRVLVMDAAILETRQAICGEDSVHKLGLYLPGRDVPDPIGQGEDAFNDCAVLIEAGTALHIGRSHR
ncbi:hypothetical protein [Streptomyces sp. KS_5]|uniref:hypothetical protein n=1 Tax=Streptomyces TaxID=1883 RepID=UPI000A6AB7CE|nr:hypothetical protein [Streptomyces sp. KS_5]